MIEDYINNEYCNHFDEKRSKKMETKIIKSVVCLLLEASEYCFMAYFFL